MPNSPFESVGYAIETVTTGVLVDVRDVSLVESVLTCSLAEGSAPEGSGVGLG